jgi:hypothetical protein
MISIIVTARMVWGSMNNTDRNNSILVLILVLGLREDKELQNPKILNGHTYLQRCLFQHYSLLLSAESQQNHY